MYMMEYCCIKCSWECCRVCNQQYLTRREAFKSARKGPFLPPPSNLRDTLRVFYIAGGAEDTRKKCGDDAGRATQSYPHAH